MSRSVLALLIIAAGLGLYLWLVEMPTEQKRVASETAARKLLDFKDEDVQAFTLASSQGETELIREKDGRWGIRKPNAMEADAAADVHALDQVLLGDRLHRPHDRADRVDELAAVLLPQLVLAEARRLWIRLLGSRLRRGRWRRWRCPCQS